jgi:hypothetical protein
MKELKRFQTIRRIEWQEAAKRKNKSFYRDPFLAEAATRFPSSEKYGDLKKQTQFMPDLMGLTPFMNGIYGDIPAGGLGENKANWGQFPASEPSEVTGKRGETFEAVDTLTG